MAARARWAGKPSFAATIAAQVDRSAGPDACWPWTGGVNEDGYGRFMFDSRSYLAHRAVLAQKLGRPLGEEEVDEILALVPTMGHGRYELLGLRYGVTGKSISNIYRRKRWRHKQADSSKEAA